MLKKELVVAVGLAAALLTGCEKKEATAPAPAPQQEAIQPPAASVPSIATEAFSTSLPAALVGKKFVVGGKANAELLNKKKFEKVADIRSEEGFELDGWALDDKAKTVPDTVVIELFDARSGNKYYAPASRNGRKRADVANFFKEPALEKAGYKVSADIKAVPPGEYEIIVVQLIDGKPSRAYPGRNINKTN